MDANRKMWLGNHVPAYNDLMDDVEYADLFTVLCWAGHYCTVSKWSCNSFFKNKKCHVLEIKSVNAML